MNATSAELKRRAKQALVGNYVICIAIQFIMKFINICLYMVMYIPLLIFVITQFAFFNSKGFNPVMFIIFCLMVIVLCFIVICVDLLLYSGYNRIYLNICNHKPVGFSDLFYAFKNKPHKFLGHSFLLVMIYCICFIPYFYVGVVASITDYIPTMVVLMILMYLVGLIGILIINLYLSMSIYILIESEDKKVFKCFKESIRMMKGNKGRFFYICISFFGMNLLGIASLGIGFYWIMPYIRCTLTEFYLDLKASETMQTYAENKDDSYESMIQQGNSQLNRVTNDFNA